MTAAVAFGLPASLYVPGTAMIKGEGPGSGAGAGALDFPPTTATTVGDIAATLGCDSAFANAVGYHDPLSISWSYSGDGGANWVAVGESQNRAYVTLADPHPTLYNHPWTTGYGYDCDGALFHTLVNLSCRNAAGATTESQVISGVWDAFTGRSVTRVENPVVLTYYGNYNTAVTITRDLLSSGDGQCGAWAKFFLDMLKCHGIRYNNNYAIVQSETSGENIRVKNWDFSTTTHSLNQDYPYLNVQNDPFIPAPDYNSYSYMFADVTDETGEEGQGNSNPASLFGNHQFAQLDGHIYDPSYGITADNLSQYEDMAIAGYFLFKDNVFLDEAVYGLDLNDNATTDTFYANIEESRTNIISTDELTFGADTY